MEEVGGGACGAHGVRVRVRVRVRARVRARVRVRAGVRFRVRARVTCIARGVRITCTRLLAYWSRVIAPMPWLGLGFG